MCMTFMTFNWGVLNHGNKIKTEFNIPDVMILKWHGLVMALPREWRNTITRAAPENLSNDLNVRIVLDGKAVLLKDLKTKTVYNIFVKGILKSPTAQESICRKLNTEITNWEETYTLTRKITIDSYSVPIEYFSIKYLIIFFT